MTAERDKKEGKAMANANIRTAHKLLNVSELCKWQIDLIRGLMPELPEQKTLEEITEHVYDAWLGTDGNEWGGNEDDPEIAIEPWLAELHAQLQGLKDTPAAVPALPAGMRIADHVVFGRVVVSPEVDMDYCYEIYHLAPGMSSGTDLSVVAPNSLTFIDSEPAHPEFLETEADYQNAPEGTTVTRDGTGTVWMKKSKSWASTVGDYVVSCPDLSVGRRRVLRWGDKK